jgi:hypothetical protein
MSGRPVVGAEPVAVGEFGVCISLPVGWEFDRLVGENALMSHADLTTADWWVCPTSGPRPGPADRRRTTPRLLSQATTTGVNGASSATSGVTCVDAGLAR